MKTKFAMKYDASTPDSVGHGDPLWISRNDNTPIDTLTAIRAAAAVLISRYTYSESIVFDATVPWSGLLPWTELSSSGTGGSSAVTLDNDTRVPELVDQIGHHASTTLTWRDIELQTVRSSLSSEASIISRVVIVVHKGRTPAEEVYDSIENGLNTGEASLMLEWLPSVDPSLVCVRHLGPHISVEDSPRLQSSFEQIFGEILMSTNETTLPKLFSISHSDTSRVLNSNGAPLHTFDTFIHHLVEQQVRQQPDAAAIHSWEGDLTYADLDHVSSQLAACLAKEYGVGPEVIVPLCFEKSLWAVVAMFAVLKAGGAFVPLDPAHPIDRVREIAAQTGAKLILSSAEHHEKCTKATGTVLIINKDTPQINSQDPGFYSVHNNTSATAYVLFTSGSTGKPKGVMIEHQQVTTFSMHAGQACGYSSKSRVLQFATYTFDVCILEIFTTLVHGGCVCIPSESQRMNDVTGFMNSAQVNLAVSTPALLVNLVPEELETLETIILGGEAVPSDLVAQWSQAVRLFIAYGPTECTVLCCLLDTGSPGTLHTGDIGFPVASRCWIVNPTDTDELMPIGTVGELLIEGPLVGRGYINDKPKTDSAFIENPKWMRRAGRLYKTGDLVRYKSDGSLNFVCRKDNQVKLRGQRLELGEVEQQIRRCFHLHQVEVAAELIKPANGRGAPFLAAFVSNPVGSRKMLARDDFHGPDLAGPLSLAAVPRRTSYAAVRQDSSSGSPLPPSANHQRPHVMSRAATSVGGYVRLALQHRTVSEADRPQRPMLSARQSDLFGSSRPVRTNSYSQSRSDNIPSRPQLSATTSSTMSILTSRSGSTFSVGSSATSCSEGSINKLLSRSVRDDQTVEAILANLKQALQDKLPGYMIPTVVIQLDEMPLSTAGKIDRRALRETALRQHNIGDKDDDGQDKKFQPLLPTEKQLQGLWAMVLNLPSDTIMSYSNFFELGGDSIASMRMVVAAHKEGISLSVAQVFTHPILSNLAARLDKEGVKVEKQLEPVAPFSMLASSQRSHVIKEAVLLCKVNEEMIEDIYPCTPLQTGMLALSTRSPGSYVMRLTYALNSSTDLERFKDAWQSVVARHPILRTRLVQTKDSDVLQVVVNGNIEWQESEIVPNAISSPPSPGATMGPGQPLAMYKLGRDIHTGQTQFIWDIHHALIDGWSLPLVLESVEQAYLGQTPLSRPPFSQFVKQLMDLDFLACEGFWRAKLDGAVTPAFPTLPTSRQRPLTTSKFQYRACMPAIARTGMTAATVIRAAWALVIAAYSDSDDVVFGHTVSGRHADVADIESMIGPTITTVPLRVSIDRTQPIRDYLCRVQKEAVDMMPFEHLGLVRISRLSDDAEAACAFQNLLVIQPPPLAPKDNAVHVMEQQGETSTEIVNYCLVMECTPSAGEVQLCARYDGAVIPAIQIERLMQQFEHIIQQLALSSNSTQVADIDLLSPVDRIEIQCWNNKIPDALTACLPDLILPHVRKQQHRPAVCAWDGDLTYGELYHLSLRLGHELRKSGVKPGVMVPICFEKSVWAVVSMLAICLAGGACVPIDPCHPANRRAWVIDNTKACLIVCSVKHRKLFEDAAQRLMVVDERYVKNLANEECTSPTLQPSDPAYIIFTSDSTGEPKGIIIEHEALCTSIQHHGKMARFDASSRVLQFAAYTFDISFSDIFATLAHGGCVCIPSDNDRLNDLETSIRDLGVNTASLTTTVARQLRPEKVKNLRTLIIAGEAPTEEILQRWASKVCLIKLYGPAECTIYSCGSAEVSSEDLPQNMGYGVGARLWITDPGDHDRLSLIGAVGELLIEGPILARSYLADEARTAASFIHNPSWLQTAEPGRSHRLYKTGDLVRYASDGSIIYCGRKDTQVKIRGQRVEFAEIEDGLSKVIGPSFTSAVEMIIPLDRKSTQMLAAFISFNNPVRAGVDEDLTSVAAADQVTFQTLRAGIDTNLREMLPSAMIPSVYIPLHHMPMSASAKADRRLLRTIASRLTLKQLTKYGAQDELVQTQRPLTGGESLMQEIWAEALGLDKTRVRLADNFFKLGGDSIKAMQLATIGRKRGISLKVEDMFNHDTLEAMSRMATLAQAEKGAEIPRLSLITERHRIAELLRAAQDQCKVQEEMIEDMYPCTPCQAASMRFPVHWPDQGQGVNGFRAQFVYRLPDDLDVDRFCSAWDTAVAANPILRTRIIEVDSEYWQVVLKVPAVWQTAENLDQYMEWDQERHMDYGEPLLRRCFVTPTGSEERFFVWSAQHAIYDGWALALLDKEIADAYYNTNIAATSEVKPSFKHLIKYMVDADDEAAGEFWRSRFDNIVPRNRGHLPRLPCANSEFDHTFTFTGHLAGSEITVATALYGAWALVLARHMRTASSTLRVVRTGRDLPVSGIEKILAPAYTQVPLVVQTDTNLPVSCFLRNIQSEMSATIPHAFYGWNRVRQLSPKARAACDAAILITVQPDQSTRAPEPPAGLEMVLARPVASHPTPILVDVFQHGERLRLKAFYDVTYLNEEQVERLLRQFQTTFQALVAAWGTECRVAHILEQIDTSDSEVICTLLGVS